MGQEDPPQSIFVIEAEGEVKPAAVQEIGAVSAMVEAFAAAGFSEGFFGVLPWHEFD